MNTHSLQTPHTEIAKLADGALLRTLGHIDGRWILASDAKEFAVSDPASGTVIARVAALGSDDVDNAISAALRAFTAWRDRLPADRASVLRRWSELVFAAREDLARIITLEQGKPLVEARREVASAVEVLDWYAGEALRISAEGVTPHLKGVETFVRREAIGPVGVVTPWNCPCAMITRKVAAALAAGCTAVVHPSSETPLSALALAELAIRAGLPAGVMNIVTGETAPIVGRMCVDRRLRAMSYTGSTEQGRIIAEQCAPTLKRMVMEMGGHAPLIVFADADIEEAVQIAMDAKFANSGQDCLSVNRIYVQRSLFPAFAARFAERIRVLRVGQGLAPETQIGPLINARAVARVSAHVRDAQARGGIVVTGGTVHPDLQLAFLPTLLVDVPEDALIHREQTCGPVASVMPFNTEAEVITRANATDYGLVAYVVTRDGARALRLSRALEYGMVAVNRVRIGGGSIPFGGWKQSGLGREGSRHGIEAFTELKYLCIDTTA